MLGLVVVLSIFGLSVKTYRAIFLQVRRLPYIEQPGLGPATCALSSVTWFRIPPLIIPGSSRWCLLCIPRPPWLCWGWAILSCRPGVVINEAAYPGALFNGWYCWILGRRCC